MSLKSIPEQAAGRGITLPCHTVDPDVMFPDERLDNTHPDVQAAKAVCLGCEFRFECAQGALRRDEQAGVWGGMTFKDRQATLRKHRRYRGVQAETLEGVM